MWIRYFNAKQILVPSTIRHGQDVPSTMYRVPNRILVNLLFGFVIWSLEFDLWSLVFGFCNFSILPFNSPR
jgi:hypothetical protein